MTRVYYKDAHACVIMFDLTQRSTFQNAVNWKKDLDSKCSLTDGTPVPCLLLANKVFVDRKYKIKFLKNQWIYIICIIIFSNFSAILKQTCIFMKKSTHWWQEFGKLQEEFEQTSSWSSFEYGQQSPENSGFYIKFATMSSLWICVSSLILYIYSIYTVY